MPSRRSRRWRGRQSSARSAFMDLFRVLRCKLNGLPKTMRRSLGIQAPRLCRTARPVPDHVGNEDHGKPSLDALLGQWLLPDTRLGWKSLCPRRSGLSRPNVTCGSGPALHDRGSEFPVWSESRNWRQEPESPVWMAPALQGLFDGAATKSGTVLCPAC